MSEILDLAIHEVTQSRKALCRFITGNDAGTTGSHQTGFYIPQCASSLLFEQPGRKGENKEKVVRIKWQNDFYTESRMKYYGKNTRNEYRITHFGRNFPFLRDENVGDLLIICQCTEEEYQGFVLSTDEDIDAFLAYFNLSPDETNRLIDINRKWTSEIRVKRLIEEFTSNQTDFPGTQEMATEAQKCYNKAYNITTQHLIDYPDDILLKWIDTEFTLFRCLEEKLYRSVISKPFSNIESFIQTANEVLNRRKSRAGKSLEHHLSNIFTQNRLIFEEQAITEENKKPDFLFPNSSCYHDFQFPAEMITILGAKTTCKDRWRQVLTEANRVEHKYLFTLQQGISRNQLKEMQDSRLTLVVPRKNITSFPHEYQKGIKSLSDFIRTVKKTQEQIPRHFLFPAN